MTWTYGPNFALARDRIRFLVGDTDTADQLVQDEEIALYTAGGQFAQSTDLAAAIEVCRAIVKKLSRRVRISAGGTSVDLQQQAQAYRDTLADLLRQSAEGAAPYAGGLTWTDRDARESDTDRVPPFFDRDRPSDGEQAWPSDWRGWWP